MYAYGTILKFRVGELSRFGTSSAARHEVPISASVSVAYTANRTWFLPIPVPLPDDPSLFD